MSKNKYFIWQINGGLGKNVAATALCKDIKQKYSDRKFILVASYPEVFLNNPYIDRVYNAGQLNHFYKDYIENKDVIICNHEPYHQTGHISKHQHLLKSWCELLNIEYNNQKPKLYYNTAQLKAYQNFPSEKPILLLQTGGGPMDDPSPYNWSRDLPEEIAQIFVQKYSQQYQIIQITRPNGYKLPNVRVMVEPMKNMGLFGLIGISQKRILIDSCLQHASAALGIPSTVLWIGTSPITFGYKIHNNIIANDSKIANQLIYSSFFNYRFNDNEEECPYNSWQEMFDQNTINGI